MPKNIYNNIEGHRLLDNGLVVEDITSITLPTIEHPTTTLAVNGMAGDLDMPNSVHVNAMEFKVAHNNGTNAKYLNDPGKHTIEVRAVRQRFVTVDADMQHESVKFRITGFFKSADKGTIETGNPYGGTNTYSVLHFEEEVNGEVITLIDVANGTIKINGKSTTDVVENMLA